MRLPKSLLQCGAPAPARRRRCKGTAPRFGSPQPDRVHLPSGMRRARSSRPADPGGREGQRPDLPNGETCAPRTRLCRADCHGREEVAWVSRRRPGQQDPHLKPRQRAPGPFRRQERHGGLLKGDGQEARLVPAWGPRWQKRLRFVFQAPGRGQPPAVFPRGAVSDPPPPGVL